MVQTFLENSMLLLALTAFAVSSESLRMTLQNLFADGCVYAIEYAVSLTIFLALATVACLAMPAKSDDPHPTPQWGIFYLLNCVVVIVSLCIGTYLLKRNAFESQYEYVLVMVASFACLLYYFGFFGVSFVARERFEPSVSSTGTHDADVVIVGAGTAGAALGVALAKQGRKVIVIEKNCAIQDRIVGELMQPGGLDALQKLGLDHCALEGMVDSIRIEGYVLISNDDGNTLLPYPDRVPQNFREYFGLDRHANGTKKPHGCAFHNGRFVNELREELKKYPNVQLIEGTVSKMRYTKDKSRVCGVVYKLPNSDETKELSCPLTVAADGMWSSLRRHVVPKNSPTVLSNFVGLIMQHKEGESPVPCPNYGHVVLAKPSPMLMYQISPTETRVLVDVPGTVPRSSTGDLAKHLLEFVAPQLPQVSRKPFVAAVHAGDIRAMPNRSLTCDYEMPGVLLLGDSYDMRHPLTGGGMTVALKDVVLLEELLKSVENLADIQRIQREFKTRRKDHASTVNVLANALYHVFSAPAGNIIRRDLRDACYAYLHMDGAFAAGPVGLLSALTPKPFILVLHFFMVAAFGMFRTLKPYPSVSRIRRCWKMLHIACVIIMPLLEKEQTTILSFWPIAALINLIFPFRRYKLGDFD